MHIHSSELKHPFPDTILSQIEEKLAAVVKSHSGPRIAAFDADGTLWNTDAGESFFQFQIDHCGLPGMPEDPWGHYEWLKEHRSHEEAYVWLGAINKGQTLEQVKKWTRQSVERMQPYPIFDSQKQILQILRKLNFEIFIVTASIKWAVEPAAELLCIPDSHVLGITVKIQDGVVTDEANHPITWREGKAKALLQRTGGVHPLFTSGNTMGDLALMETSKGASLVISSAPPGSVNYETELKLIDVAKQRGWFYHRYVD